MTDKQRKLGRYELLRRLATGGMGEIYLARTRGAGGFEKLMIIKTILPHLAEQEEFVTKFLDEGRIVVQLTHGNIVPVFDMGEEDGEYFIAMEYLPGLDLRAILKRLNHRGEELPVELALYIASEVCKGLGYAHRKLDDQGNPLDIVHRDVSPSNVLVSREGEVKIIDFGIARATGKVAQTASGRIQGKCCYMSPEQARGKPLDARSDIFSTGVLLFEMLTLTRPFEGRSDLESLELVRQCDTDPPGVLRPSIPEEVDEIVCRAMALDPDDRYPTSDDLLVDLQHEIYRLGHTVTSQRLSTALCGVFDDEEAEGLADDTPAAPPANLDEALELELARLGEDPTPSSQPSASSLALAATADSPQGGTRTMSTTPGARPRDRDAKSTEYSAPDSHSHPSFQTGPPSAQFNELDGSDRKRWWAAPLIAVVILVIFITTFLVLAPVEDGILDLTTNPPGAQIHLDGDELVGLRTPESLALAPGSYSLELTLEDHRPRQFRVDIDPGEVIILNEQDLSLIPERSPPRRFEVITDPENATLVVDGESLGAGPHDLEVAPDEVLNLSARAPGCSTISYTLTHSHQRDQINLALQCDTDDEPAVKSDDGDDSENDEALAEASRRSDSRPSGPRTRSIRIDSEPPGAEIVVNDELIGTSPVYADLRQHPPPTIEARHDGFQTLRTTPSATDFVNGRLQLPLTRHPRGCLTFRAVYPANNEIAINGNWLNGRHSTLQDHSLPAGENIITVRHPESEREESFDVTIDAGDHCKVLTVWERD